VSVLKCHRQTDHKKHDMSSAPASRQSCCLFSSSRRKFTSVSLSISRSSKLRRKSDVCRHSSIITRPKPVICFFHSQCQLVYISSISYDPVHQCRQFKQFQTIFFTLFSGPTLDLPARKPQIISTNHHHPTTTQAPPILSYKLFAAFTHTSK